MKKSLSLVVFLATSNVLGANTEEKTFDGWYFGAGFGMNRVMYNSYRLGVAGVADGAMVNYDEQKVNRPMGTLFAGYGKVFCKNIYIGGECLFDIAPNKTKSVLVGGKEITEIAHDSDGGYVKYKGFSTQLGLRVGFVFDKANTMIYMRPAMSFFNEMELWNDSRRNFSGPDGKLEGHPKKLGFALAFGAETVISEGWSIRLEGERLFKRSFTGSSFGAHGGVDTGWRTKANTDAYNVRLLISRGLR